MLNKEFKYLFSLVFIFLLSSCDQYSGCEKCYLEQKKLNKLTDKAMLLASKQTKLESNELIDTLLKGKELDAWNYERRYQIYEASNEWCIFIWSFGADGKPGGEKIYDKDIYGLGSKGQCITKVST